MNDNTTVTNGIDAEYIWGNGIDADYLWGESFSRWLDEVEQAEFYEWFVTAWG